MLGDRGDVYHAKPPLSRVPCTLRSDRSCACHLPRYREILPNRIFPCQGATLGMPYTYTMGEGLFELRVTGQEGIARVFYGFIPRSRMPSCRAREEIMPNGTDDQQSASRGLSRRNLFKRAGVVGVVAATSGATLALNTPVTAQAQTPAPAAPPLLEALETLTAAESDILEAIVARLIPTDENGPGAAEARAAHYIDRALAGPLSSSRRAYAAGLAAIDAYAQSAKGAPFTKLAAQDQDAVLSDMEKNVAKGFAPTSSAFFNLLRA